MNTVYRMEDKYCLSSSDTIELEERLKKVLRIDPFCADGNGYKVSSLYFDDYYDTHYFDVESGNPERTKFRIRIYNNSLDVIKLEIKKKKYNRILKCSEIISKAEMRQLMRGETIEWGDTLDTPRSLFNKAILENRLLPSTIISYFRMTFVNTVGNVRISFDSCIGTNQMIELFGTDDIDYIFPYKQDRILEVKYDEMLPDYIAQLLEINTIQQISFSKYRICRDCLRRG